MKKIKYLLLVLFGLLIITSVIIMNDRANNVDKGQLDEEIHVFTERDAFCSVSVGKRSVEEVDGEFFFLIGITPAKFPEEAGTIYQSVKEGKTVFVTLTDRIPERTFRIEGGLSKDGYMRIRCRSLEECSQMRVPWSLY
jgi:hypothetical protein